MYKIHGNSVSCDHTNCYFTVEPDLMAKKMLSFPSKSSGNKNDSDLVIASHKREGNSYIKYNGYNFYSEFQQ